MQYTIRNVPKRIDRELRRLARAQNKSLNQVALEALASAVGVLEEGVRYRDLGDLAGSWVDDPEFDQAILDQDVLDEELWR